MKNFSFINKMYFLFLLMLLPNTILAETIQSSPGKTAQPELIINSGDSHFISSVISPDENFILSCNGYSLKLLDVTTGKLIRTFSDKNRGNTIFVSANFSPDNRSVIAADYQGKIRLWNLATGKLAKTFSKHSLNIQGTIVVSSPDSRYILSGHRDATLNLWDVASEKHLKTFTGHKAAITSIAFSPDSKSVISASMDTTVKLWSIATGKEIKSFAGHSGEVLSVAVSPDGRFILSGSVNEPANEKGVLRLWDLDTGIELKSFIGHKADIGAIAFSPDGKYGLSGTSPQYGGGVLKLWDLDNGTEIKTFTGHTGAITSVTFSSDGKYGLSGSDDQTLKLWNLETGKEVKTFSGHSASIFSVIFSPDNSYALSGENENNLKLWDIETGREVRTFTSDMGGINSLDFSSDGKYVLAGSIWPTIVKVWDINSGDEIISKPDLKSGQFWDYKKWCANVNKQELTDHFPDLYRAYCTDYFKDFIPVGQSLKTRCDFLKNNKKTRQLYMPFYKRYCEGILKNFDPAIPHIVGANSWGEIILNENDRAIRIDRDENDIAVLKSLSFSPDSQQILAAFADNSIKVWDADTGNIRKAFTIPAAPGQKTYNVVLTDMYAGYLDPVVQNMSKEASDTLDIQLQKFQSAKYDWISGDNYTFCSKITFSPDAKYLLASNVDNSLQLYDINSNIKIKSFIGHPSTISAVTFSPDGKFGLSSSLSKNYSNSILILWDITNGKKLKTFTCPGFVTSVSFSPDRSFALYGTLDGLLTLLHIDSNKELKSFIGHQDGISATAFSPDGKYILSGSFGETLKLWDVDSGKELQTLSGHENAVTSVSFSQNGKYGLSGGADGNVIKWNLLKGKLDQKYPDILGGQPVFAAAYVPNGHHIVAGGGYWPKGIIVSIDTLLRKAAIDYKNGKPPSQMNFSSSYNGHQSLDVLHMSADNTHILTSKTMPNSIDSILNSSIIGSNQSRILIVPSGKNHAVAFSSNGRFALSGSSVLYKEKAVIKLWDINNGKVVKTFPGHPDDVKAVAFVPDSTHIISGDSTGVLKVWDKVNGKELKSFSGNKDKVRSLTFSPNGRLALLGSRDKIKLWDMADGKAMQTFKGHTNFVNSSAFSPDGKSILCGYPDGTMKLWAMNNGKVKFIPGHKDGVSSVSFSPNGVYTLSTGADSTIRLRHISSDREYKVYNAESSLHSASFSSDGIHVVAADSLGKSLIIWNILLNKSIQVPLNSNYIIGLIAIAFSPDGQLAALLKPDSSNFTISSNFKILNTLTGKEIQTFTGHKNEISVLTFSPDGQHILSGSLDGILKLWDVKSGAEVASYNVHPYGISDAAFSPDSRYILAGGGDSVMKLWDTQGGGVKTLFGHNNYASSISFSPDGRYALSSDPDHTNFLWDVTAGTWLVKWILFDDGTWAVIDQDGKYDASNNGDIAGLHWVVGNTPVDLSQYKEQYYEPGLLARVMQWGPE